MSEVKLYLDGIECVLSIPTAGGSPEAIAAAAAAQVRAYLAAGFTPDAVQTAVQTAVIDRVVRRQHVRDGRRTPVIDMYQVGQQKRFLGVYLNTPQEIEAFEAAAGARLESLPLCDADAPLQLDVEAQQERAKKFVRALAKPFSVEWRLNPKYSPDDKKTAKRLLVSYVEADAAQQPEQKPVPAPLGKSEPVEEIRLKKLASGWGVIVRTAQRSHHVPAELVGTWSLSSTLKSRLKRDKILDGIGIQAVIRDNILVDVQEISF
jgi:hypothetical protein